MESYRVPSWCTLRNPKVGWVWGGYLGRFDEEMWLGSGRSVYISCLCIHLLPLPIYLFQLVDRAPSGIQKCVLNMVLLRVLFASLLRSTLR